MARNIGESARYNEISRCSALGALESQPVWVGESFRAGSSPLFLARKSMGPWRGSISKYISAPTAFDQVLFLHQFCREEIQKGADAGTTTQVAMNK